jgi:hypothetical protein
MIHSQMSDCLLSLTTTSRLNTLSVVCCEMDDHLPPHTGLRQVCSWSARTRLQIFITYHFGLWWWRQGQCLKCRMVTLHWHFWLPQKMSLHLVAAKFIYRTDLGLYLVYIIVSTEVYHNYQNTVVQFWPGENDTLHLSQICVYIFWLA